LEKSVFCNTGQFLLQFKFQSEQIIPNVDWLSFVCDI